MFDQRILTDKEICVKAAPRGRGALHNAFPTLNEGMVNKIMTTRGVKYTKWDFQFNRGRLEMTNSWPGNKSCREEPEEKAKMYREEKRKENDEIKINKSRSCPQEKFQELNSRYILRHV